MQVPSEVSGSPGAGVVQPSDVGTELNPALCCKVLQALQQCRACSLAHLYSLLFVLAVLDLQLDQASLEPRDQLALSPSGD